MDKREIIALSKQINTYDISALPYGDCCSYFLPKHPELKSSTKKLQTIEKEFDVEALVEDAVKNSKITEL